MQQHRRGNPESAGQSAEDPFDGGLSAEELDAEDVVELPDREAMSIVAPPMSHLPVEPPD